MEKHNSILNIPTAIIIAGAIIAGSIIWTMKPANTGNNLAAVAEDTQQIPLVTEKDHILGNPNAKIKIVEYSDTSCPFCKVFHTTMRKLMDEYGKSGNVAWVYRHFPIDKPDALGRILHPNAGKEAQALECAAELGGNDAFWAYTNRLYEITPSVTPDSPNGLDQAELPKIASAVGISVGTFNTCLSSGKYKDKVEENYIQGINAGIEGTPSSFILTPGDKIIPVSGAQSYETLKQAIEALLNDKNSIVPNRIE